MDNTVGQKKILKIMATSDSHGKFDELEKKIKDGVEGDLFIHCGDFSWYNKKEHFFRFLQTLQNLKFKRKILIPGNHEILLDPNFSEEDRKGLGYSYVHPEMTREKQVQRLKQAGCQIVEHDYIEIEGLRIFASAYTIIPFYYRTAYQVSEEKMEEIWLGVPEEIDLLVTHGPPHGVLDRTMENGENVGSKKVREYLNRTHAKIHIFGHIHEAKGQQKVNEVQCFNIAEQIKFFDLQVGAKP